MYDYRDRGAAIMEIQKFLSIISEKHKSMPHVTVDGYFGEETRLAVIEFQALNNLELNGIVDKVTFDMIYGEYSELLLERSLIDENYNPNAFPLKRGDSGNDVDTLNKILRELRVYYKELIMTEDDFFNADTEYSVKEMQRHLGKEINGIVDNVFLNRLKEELKIRRKFISTK